MVSLFNVTNVISWKLALDDNKVLNVVFKVWSKQNQQWVYVFFLQAEENLGMVMIFTLVTAVQEKLNEIVDLIKNRREEEKQRKEREAEEAEKVWIPHHMFYVH